MDEVRIRRGRWAVALTAVIAAACVQAGVAQAQPAGTPAPIGLPALPGFDAEFYRPAPERYADLAPGQIISTRPVTVANLSLVPVNVDAWQVSYRSTNTRGEPIAAVATVMKPRGYQADRPLLSYQIAEDSLGSYCAPSYELQLGSIPVNFTGSNLVALQFPEIEAGLAQGWAVVVPDYQGPDEAYAAGPLAGRITLDGIRAAENLDAAQLPGAATRVTMMGYSGGAIATGHAAELHAGYAPELRVQGAAEGGIPADLLAVLRGADGGLGSGLILAAVMGVAREYPDIAAYLDRHLTPLGRGLVGLKQGLCAAYQSLLTPFTDYTAVLDRNPLEDPEFTGLMGQVTLGQHVPDMPMLMYQANPDWLVPVGQVNALVDIYCAAPDARVQYLRDHFSEHLTLDFLGVPRALAWLRDRYADVPAAAGCSTQDVPSLALEPDTAQTWASIMGTQLAALFQQPIGAGH